MKTSIILVAAGQGARFGQAKWSVDLLGKSLLEWNLELFRKLEFAHEVIIVAPSKHLDEIMSLDYLKDEQVIPGGEQRSDSVKNGLEASQGDVAIIHNVANPLADEQDFLQLQQWVSKEDCAAFVGQPVVDTLRRVDEDKTSTVDRTNVWRVQTPQAFRRSSLLQFMNEDQESLTDEVQFYERQSLPVKAFITNKLNHKITFPTDLNWAEALLTKETLIGLGEDSHPFDTTGKMMLGGVEVADLPKLKGNSDGDVILHALYNAISSALGEKSIGPTADPMAEQGILDSAKYLEVILEQVEEEGFQPYQVSISLECLRPKIDPLVEGLKERISGILSIPKKRIGITATTGENLTSFGRGEAVKCHIVVSLIRHS
jgi:2-C-methyl-D-erythritol 4-phosphate cytidylyltransferase/2-C-methyl-D-erythritol 2,4-cyclodiphosphate synthase